MSSKLRQADRLRKFADERAGEAYIAFSLAHAAKADSNAPFEQAEKLVLEFALDLDLDEDEPKRPERARPFKSDDDETLKVTLPSFRHLFDAGYAHHAMGLVRAHAVACHMMPTLTKESIAFFGELELEIRDMGGKGDDNGVCTLLAVRRTLWRMDPKPEQLDDLDCIIDEALTDRITERIMGGWTEDPLGILPQC